MRKIFFVVTLLTASPSVFGQFSVLQDKGGESTILFKDPSAANIQVNAADESFKLSMFSEHNYYPDPKHSTKYRNLTMGASLKIKSVDGVASLVKGGQFNPGISGTFLFGTTAGFAGGLGEDDNKDIDLVPVIYGVLNIDYSKFNLVNATKPFTFDRRSFASIIATVGINKTGGFTANSDFVFGGQVKFGKFNNLNDLDNVDIYNAQSMTQGGSTTTKLSGQKSGFEGTYEEGFCMRMNVDMYVYPHAMRNNPMGFGGYIRSEVIGFAPRQNAGLGVIFGQRGAPSAVAFALMYQFNDIFDQQGAGGSAFSRGGLNLIAGFNFK